MNMYAANETIEKHNVIIYFWVVDHYQFMAITPNNKPTMYEFYWMLKGKLQCILTISHLASLFQNLKHANHLALHFAPLCVLSGQNLLLSYVESPIVILSYSPFAKQNQTEDWQIFKSFCIEIKVLKESKYKMPLVHCAFAMYYRYLLECQW